MITQSKMSDVWEEVRGIDESILSAMRIAREEQEKKIESLEISLAHTIKTLLRISRGGFKEKLSILVSDLRAEGLDEKLLIPLVMAVAKTDNRCDAQ